jgi:glutamyl-tRNA reductase
MKPNLDESYESWCERVRLYEHGHALQRLAKGESIEIIMKDMARRIEEKLLHPLIKKQQDENQTI